MCGKNVGIASLSQTIMHHFFTPESVVDDHAQPSVYLSPRMMPIIPKPYTVLARDEILSLLYLILLVSWRRVAS